MNFLDAFAELPDPRTRSCMHQLEELLFAALCAITSGADSWAEVAQWTELKLDWLRRYFPFGNGAASHDTFSRVFSLLDAKCFEACFINWMQQLCPSLQGQVVPIDGKSVRGSHDGANGGMTHLVSAWGSSAGLVLGQVKTAAKSNEITAIPELLDALDVKGATITIDAMGCQRVIVQKILDKQADYIIAVKDNQPSLAQAIESMFPAKAADARGVGFEQHLSVDKGHGRLETRHCVVINDLSSLNLQGPAWPGLRSVAMVESTREAINGKDKGEISTEWRYYISSLQLGARDINERVRSHWSIENSCHWIMDMVYREDDSRIRIGHGAENFAVLRRISLNLIKQRKAGKTSFRGRRLKASWSTDYLEAVLGLTPASSG